MGLPFSWLYDLVMRIRNKMYDSGKLKTYKFDKPIVSVGNLTMGGTGKTPIICKLLHFWALEQGLRPAVISRGYKSKVRGVAKVHLDIKTNYFGDEPAMVVNRFPNVPFYIGADRVAVVESVLANESVDIIFADDAFQHRQFHAVDIVDLECTEDKMNYQVLPAGRGRERVSGLKRADYIILNKVNLVAPEKKMEVLDFITQNCVGDEVPIIESEYYVKNLKRLSNQEKAELVSSEKVLLY